MSRIFTLSSASTRAAAEVFSDQIVTSSITKDAAEELGLAVGQQATALIKSTEVTIGVE